MSLSSNPPRVLLLAGLLCDRTVWEGVVARLAPRYAVTTVSFEGFESIEAMARHALGDGGAPLAVVGHSMGGRVAFEMWRQAPQRIAGLALLDTGVHARQPQEVAGRQRLVELARTVGMRAVCEAWLPPMMGAPAERVAALMPALRAMVERQTLASFAGQIKALLERPEATGLLAGITVPTLIATGRNDHWASVDQHEAIHRQIPGSTFAVIESAGHMALCEQPAAVAALLETWLDQVIGRRSA